MSAVTIDLNSDLGEGFGPWSMGDDRGILAVVTSANVACGGHAGDNETMFATCAAAVELGAIVGAHPGYLDREGFGRRIIPMALDEIGRMVVAQVGALDAVARLAGTRVRYCKPHGALGNLAAADAAVAGAILDALEGAFPGLPVLAISGTHFDQEARRRGHEVYSEVFADRGYQPDGQLVPRGQPGAMITDHAEAADRLLALLDTGLMPTVGGDPIPLAAHSICVHGDSPSAVAMAEQVHRALTASGVTVAPFVAPLVAS